MRFVQVDIYMTKTSLQEKIDSVRVYVSILNWNSYEETIRCVKMVQLQPYQNIKIIIVDNASSDNSVEQIRAEFPDLTLIVAEENRGYAAGHHLAVEIALSEKADLIWLLNTDIEFFDDRTLEALVEAYFEHDEAIYGSVILKTATPPTVGILYYTEDKSDNAITIFNEGDTYTPQQYAGRSVEVAEVYGSSFMIPLEVIQKHGFMDTGFSSMARKQIIAHGSQDWMYQFFLLLRLSSFTRPIRKPSIILASVKS